MANNITYTDVGHTTTSLPDALRDIYSNELQFTALPDLVFDQFAEIKNEHRLEHGETAHWTIFRRLPPTIGSLVETVDVDTQRMQDFQVNMSVFEYGNAVGTTKKLDLLSYFGPISSIVREQLAPQMALTVDTLARNAAWSGAPKRYVGGHTARSQLLSSDVATMDTVKQAAHTLRMGRVMEEAGGFICVCHPSVVYDLREDPMWEDPARYSDPSRLARGEVGRYYGVRFVQSNLARLPNAGAATVSTTLTGAHSVGDTSLTMASTVGLSDGDEISLFAAAQSTPDGTGTTEEPVIIASVDDANNVTLEQGLAIDHANGDKIRLGLDVFPLMFMGADKPYGKAVVANPSVVVSPQTDKLKRMSYVGWYGLFGFGVIRDWTYLVVESAASQDSKYTFGF